MRTAVGQGQARGRGSRGGIARLASSLMPRAIKPARTTFGPQRAHRPAGKPAAAEFRQQRAGRRIDQHHGVELVARRGGLGVRDQAPGRLEPDCGIDARRRRTAAVRRGCLLRWRRCRSDASTSLDLHALRPPECRPPRCRSMVRSKASSTRRGSVCAPTGIAGSGSTDVARRRAAPTASGRPGTSSPRPSVLSTAMSPPIACASRREMARPRPVPPLRPAQRPLGLRELREQPRQVVRADADAGILDADRDAEPAVARQAGASAPDADAHQHAAARR